MGPNILAEDLAVHQVIAATLSETKAYALDIMHKDTEFSSILLSWSLAQFMDGGLCSGKIEKLKDSFDSHSEYAKAFLWMPLEEVRSQVAQGISVLGEKQCQRVLLEDIEAHSQSLYVQFTSMNELESKDEETQTNIDYEEMSRGHLLLLTSQKVHKVEDLHKPDLFYSFAIQQQSWKKKGDDSFPHHVAKIIVNAGAPIAEALEDSLHHRARHEWHVITLTPTTTNMHIWNALKGSTLNEAVSCIMQDFLSPATTLGCHTAAAVPASHQCQAKSDDVRKEFVDGYCKAMGLNNSQREAVVAASEIVAKGRVAVNNDPLLEPESRRTLLIQGPPGTGKTSTIIWMLSSLVDQGHRVLMTAPTITAIREVARRYMELVVASQGFEHTANTNPSPNPAPFWQRQQQKLQPQEQRQQQRQEFSSYMSATASVLAPELRLPHMHLGDMVLICKKNNLGGSKALGKILVDDRSERLALAINFPNLAKSAVQVMASPVKAFEEEARKSKQEAEKTGGLEGYSHTEFFLYLRKKLEDLATHANVLLEDLPSAVLNRHTRLVVESIVTRCSLVAKELVKQSARQHEALFASLREVMRRSESEQEDPPKSMANTSSMCEKLCELTHLLRSGAEMVDSQFSTDRGLKEVLNVAHDPERLVVSLKGWCVSSSRLLFCTVSASACGLCSNSNFEVLIVDEASQLVEAEVFIPLTCHPSLRTAILVGDDQQLPATVMSKLNKERGYGRSLFSRLKSAGWQPSLMLQEQYRMVPGISRWISRQYYESNLLDGPNVQDPAYGQQFLELLPLALKSLGPVALIHVEEGEEEQPPLSASRRNHLEAHIARDIVHRLSKAVVEEGKQSQVSVGIISPYTAQVQLISEQLSSFCKVTTSKPPEGKAWFPGAEELKFPVEVQTVDGFQGREMDVIILSTVNVASLSRFLADHRRLNVAVSRARYMVLVIGNLNALEQDEHWASLMDYAQEQGFTVDGSIANDLLRIPLRNVQYEKKELERIFDANRLLFADANWIMEYRKDFKTAFVALPRRQRAEVTLTLEHLARGKRKLGCITRAPSSAAVAKLIRVQKVPNLPYYLIWTVDVMSISGAEPHVTQVIMFWSLVTGAGIRGAVKQVVQELQNYTPEFIEMCKKLKQSENRKEQYPETFRAVSELLRFRRTTADSESTSKQDAASPRGNAEGLDNGNEEAGGVAEATESSMVMRKYYPLNSYTARALLSAKEGEELNLLFELDDAQKAILGFKRSCFVLGRSGTGKTTVIEHKVLEVEMARIAATAENGREGTEDVSAADNPSAPAVALVTSVARVDDGGSSALGEHTDNQARDERGFLPNQGRQIQAAETAEATLPYGTRMLDPLRRDEGNELYPCRLQEQALTKPSRNEADVSVGKQADDAFRGQDTSNKLQAEQPEDGLEGKQILNSLKESQVKSSPAHCRQVVVTLSPKLCMTFRRSIANKVATLQHALSPSAVVTQGDELFEDLMLDAEEERRLLGDVPNDISQLQDHHFPLVITYRKFLEMLDGSLLWPFPGRLANSQLLGRTHLERRSFMSDARDGDEAEDDIPSDQRNANRQRDACVVSQGEEIDYVRFVAAYWPHMDTNLTRRSDPSTVFTEISSVIKGGADALHSDLGRLEEGQYLSLAQSARSTISEAQRASIFKLYEQYEKMRRQSGDWDMADWVGHIYRELVAGRVNGFEGRSLTDTFHYIYVDEVQDLMLSQIILFRFVCDNVGSGYVLAGDTAQTIARGVVFTFEQLKNVFYKEFLKVELPNIQIASTGRKLPQCMPNKALMPEMFQLYQNFRTHQGVVELAGSVVRVLTHFFEGSIDKLQPEKSERYGERPIILKADAEDPDCDPIARIFERGALAMTAGSGGCEFGAEQAIIVRDDVAKQRLVRRIGRGRALVLTVHECKGLEFNVVLVYDFFSDSVAENRWRLMYTYMEDKELFYDPSTHDSSQAAQEATQVPGLGLVRRREYPRFDSTKHNVLLSELKQLYVVVTRARDRLLFFDSKPDLLEPVKYLWESEKVVQVRKMDQELENSLRVESTPEEWRKKGQELFNLQMFADAAKYFEKAGDTDNMKWAQAAALQKAAKELSNKPSVAGGKFLQAAVLFEDIQKLAQAAECRKSGHDWWEAARLYNQLGRWEEAGDCFVKACVWAQAAQAYSKARKYEQALQACLKGDFETQLLGLELMRSWTSPDATPQSSHPTPKLEDLMDRYTRAAALHCVASPLPEVKKKALVFVRAFPSLDDRIRFLEYFEFYDEVIQIYSEARNYKKAAELCEMKGDVLRATEMRALGGECLPALQTLAEHARAITIWASQKDASGGLPTRCSDRKQLQQIQVSTSNILARLAEENSSAAPVGVQYIAEEIELLAQSVDVGGDAQKWRSHVEAVYAQIGSKTWAEAGMLRLLVCHSWLAAGFDDTKPGSSTFLEQVEQLINKVKQYRRCICTAQQVLSAVERQQPLDREQQVPVRDALMDYMCASPHKLPHMVYLMYPMALAFMSASDLRELSGARAEAQMSKFAVAAAAFWRRKLHQMGDRFLKCVNALLPSLAPDYEKWAEALPLTKNPVSEKDPVKNDGTSQNTASHLQPSVLRLRLCLFKWLLFKDRISMFKGKGPDEAVHDPELSKLQQGLEHVKKVLLSLLWPKLPCLVPMRELSQNRNNQDIASLWEELTHYVLRNGKPTMMQPSSPNSKADNRAPFARPAVSRQLALHPTLTYEALCQILLMQPYVLQGWMNAAEKRGEVVWGHPGAVNPTQPRAPLREPWEFLVEALTLADALRRTAIAQSPASLLLNNGRLRDAPHPSFSFVTSKTLGALQKFRFVTNWKEELANYPSPFTFMDALERECVHAIAIVTNLHNAMMPTSLARNHLTAPSSSPALSQILRNRLYYRDDLAKQLLDVLCGVLRFLLRRVEKPVLWLQSFDLVNEQKAAGPSVRPLSQQDRRHLMQQKQKDQTRGVLYNLQSTGPVVTSVSSVQPYMSILVGRVLALASTLALNLKRFELDPVQELLVLVKSLAMNAEWSAVVGGLPLPLRAWVNKMGVKKAEHYTRMDLLSDVSRWTDCCGDPLIALQRYDTRDRSVLAYAEPVVVGIVNKETQIPEFDYRPLLGQSNTPEQAAEETPSVPSHEIGPQAQEEVEVEEDAPGGEQLQVLEPEDASVELIAPWIQERLKSMLTRIRLEKKGELSPLARAQRTARVELCGKEVGAALDVMYKGFSPFKRRCARLMLELIVVEEVCPLLVELHELLEGLKIRMEAIKKARKAALGDGYANTTALFSMHLQLQSVEKAIEKLDISNLVFKLLPSASQFCKEAFERATQEQLSFARKTLLDIQEKFNSASESL